MTLSSGAARTSSIGVTAPWRAQAPAVAVAAPWRASALVVDAVTLLAVVALIPFAILAIGLPVALIARGVIWIAGLF